jgi:F1F0 ATPase subunit 2
MTPMREALTLVLGGAAGVLLGAFFFGGLWVTIRLAVPSERSAPWFLGSMLLRTGVTIEGFYLVSRAHWERLPSCALGFFAASIAVTLCTRLQGRGPRPPPVEATDAP